MKTLFSMIIVILVATPVQAGCEWILWHLIYEPKATAEGKLPERRPVGAYESKSECMTAAARTASVRDLPENLRSGITVDSNSLGWSRRLADGGQVAFDCFPASFDYKGSSRSYYK